jgi:hypothetical protein
MQEMLSSASGVLFIAAWFIAAVAVFYTLIELVAVIGFASFAFASGTAVVRLKEPLLVRPAALPSKGTTPHAVFRLISPERCLFREPALRLTFLRFTGPFYLKGSIDFRDGEAVTVGRLALGPSVLWLACLTAWTVGGLGLFVQGDSSGPGGIALFLLFGWAVLGITAAISIGFARWYFQRAYAEVRDALQPTILL